MPSLEWLTAQPLAHRGLHAAQAGVIENTAPAFAAAIAGGYGIECDVQMSADGEAMVHHDDALGRLTEGAGQLASMTAAALKAVRFKNCTDHMLTLGELCDLVDGRATLLVELKSHFDGDGQLPRRVADVLSAYSGPAAVMSFDPRIMADFRNSAPGIPRGMVAERYYAHPEWNMLSRFEKQRMAHLLHAGRTRPQFIAYAAKDLPAAAPWIARNMFGLPLLSWTIRSEKDWRRASRWADQMIFEGWQPQTANAGT